MPFTATRALARPALLSYLGGISDRGHGVLFTDAEPVAARIQAEFLRAGLAANWYCVYAAAGDDLDASRALLRAGGIEPDHYPSDLAVLSRRALTGSGAHVDVERWTTALDHVFASAAHQGKRGVRWAGELPNDFLSRGQPAEWVRLERLFDQRAPNYSVLCAYDAQQAFHRTIREVLRLGAPARSRPFADLHSFAIHALDDQSFQLTENFPGGLHPIQAHYPVPVEGAPSAR
jgi:hypothetical protein